MASAVDFEHLGLFYGSESEYLDATGEFIEAGLALGEPVLVSVPGAKHRALRSRLNSSADVVEFWDMNQLGRNPGRIIPAVHAWVQGQGSGRCRFIGEPIWPGRSGTEIVEATRHEALINLAFADSAATILCPYDARFLDDAVLADAERTHPLLLRGGCGCASYAYTDPLELWRAREWPMLAPAEGAAVLGGSVDLGAIRRFAAAELGRLGLSGMRLHDGVLAVDEAATNAIVHGGGSADVRIWRQGNRVLCEVADGGVLVNPLAGRHRPGIDWTSGRGVWLMNQVCDLVELRPTERGTVARMHLELADRAA